MTLDLNAGKLLGLFAPIWPLLIVALLVNPAAWSAWEVAAFFAFPLLATGLLWGLARRRWRLELTPEALAHHTLGRTERFDWRAIGPFEVHGLPIGPKTLRFAYPAAADGSGPQRRLLLVFGDRSGIETAVTLEKFRQLYIRAPAAPEPTDSTISLPMSWSALVRWLLPAFFLLGMGLAALGGSDSPVSHRPALYGIVAAGVALIALAARQHRLVLDEDGLTILRWGRATEISWMALEEAVLLRGGVWPFRQPVLTLAWRGDRPPLRRTRIGDLYGRRLETLLPIIDERRIAAIEAANR